VIEGVVPKINPDGSAVVRECVRLCDMPVSHFLVQYDTVRLLKLFASHHQGFDRERSRDRHRPLLCALRINNE